MNPVFENNTNGFSYNSPYSNGNGNGNGNASVYGGYGGYNYNSNDGLNRYNSAFNGSDSGQKRESGPYNNPQNAEMNGRYSNGANQEIGGKYPEEEFVYNDIPVYGNTSSSDHNYNTGYGY